MKFDWCFLLVNIQNNKPNLKMLNDHYTLSFNNSPLQNSLPNQIVFFTSFNTGLIIDGYYENSYPITALNIITYGLNVNNY